MKTLFKSGIGAVCAVLFVTSWGFCGAPLQRHAGLAGSPVSILLNQPNLLKLLALEAEHSRPLGQEAEFAVVPNVGAPTGKILPKKAPVWYFDKNCLVVEEEITLTESCEMECTETYYSDEQPQPGDYDYEEPAWYEDEDEDDSEYDGNCIKSECGSIELIDDLTYTHCVKPGQAGECDSISETYREEEPRYCVEDCCSEWDKRGDCLEEICCKWESIEILTTTCSKSE